MLAPELEEIARSANLFTIVAKDPASFADPILYGVVQNNFFTASLRTEMKQSSRSLQLGVTPIEKARGFLAQSKKKFKNASNETPNSSVQSDDTTVPLDQAQVMEEIGSQDIETRSRGSSSIGDEQPAWPGFRIIRGDVDDYGNIYEGLPNNATPPLCVLWHALQNGPIGLALRQKWPIETGPPLIAMISRRGAIKLMLFSLTYWKRCIDSGKLNGTTVLATLSLATCVMIYPKAIFGAMVVISINWVTKWFELPKGFGSTFGML